MGLIPNGTYRNIGPATLFDAASEFDLDLIQRLLGIAKSAAEGDGDSDQLLEQAKQQSPFLEKLWALYPTDPKLRLDWWRNVIAALTLICAFIYSSRKSDPVHATIPPEFVDAIRSANQSPPASDPTKMNRRARRTEQRRKGRSP